MTALPRQFQTHGFAKVSTYLILVTIFKIKPAKSSNYQHFWHVSLGGLTYDHNTVRTFSKRFS